MDYNPIPTVIVTKDLISLWYNIDVNSQTHKFPNPFEPNPITKQTHSFNKNHCDRDNEYYSS